MRFTSTDPAASPFYNLFSYCGNDPGNAYDPDGLTGERWNSQSWFGDIWRAGWGWVDNTVGANGWLAGGGQIAGGAADAAYFLATMPVQHIIWATTGNAPMPIQHMIDTANNTTKRWDLMTNAGSSLGDKLLAVGGLGLADMAGVTTFAEAWHGGDSVTGNRLTTAERNARWVTGGFAMAMYAAPVAGKSLGLARTTVRAIGTAIQESSLSRPRVMLPRANRGAVLNPWRAFSRDPAIQEALQNGDIHEIRTHGNRLDSSGPRTVYAVREAGTGKVLHIGETADIVSRTRQHIADFKELGKKVYVDPRRVVSGKQAALDLQERYIRTYERVFGKKPPYNKSYR